MSRVMSPATATALRLHWKLTRAQLDALRVARDHGHAFALTGIRARAGGARSRMCEGLGARGLLSSRAPWTITRLGRDALKAYGK